MRSIFEAGWHNLMKSKRKKIYDFHFLFLFLLMHDFHASYCFNAVLLQRDLFKYLLFNRCVWHWLRRRWPRRTAWWSILKPLKLWVVHLSSALTKQVNAKIFVLYVCHYLKKCRGVLVNLIIWIPGRYFESQMLGAENNLSGCFIHV